MSGSRAPFALEAMSIAAVFLVNAIVAAESAAIDEPALEDKRTMASVA